MPRFDGGGPQGIGPMSGRGLGYCAVPYSGKYFGAGLGRRFGRGGGCRSGYGYGFGPGFGFGYGMGRAAWSQDVERTERDFLEEERDMLKARLKVLERELKDE